jgi:hypothetical protein
MALAPTSVSFGSLSLDDDPQGDYHLTLISGWEGLPEARYDSIGRPSSHGEFDGPVYSAARLVHLEGECRDEDTRDELLADLGAGLGFAGRGPAQDLTVTLGGRTLTSSAKVLRYSPAIARGDWGNGWFGWQADFRCADPLRYGDVQTAQTGMPVASGGLDFPIGSVFDFGIAGSTGSVDLGNPGTADAPTILRVDGPAAGGFVITESGDGNRLRFVDPVDTGSWITINAATGRVTINDQADRRGSLAVAQFAGFVIPAGASRQFEFTGDTATDPAALLTVTARPAYW